MSVWGDMRRRAEGTVVRKEDLPPVDPDAEKKRQEDTARWYSIQEEIRKRKKESRCRTYITWTLFAIYLCTIMILFFGIIGVALIPIIGASTYLISRLINDYYDEW